MPPKTINVTSTPPISTGKQAKSIPIDFQNQYACWQVGQFDLEGKWGMESVLGSIEFSVSTELYELLIEYGDNDLCDILEALAKTKHASFSDFYQKLKNAFKNKIPSNIVHQISLDISSSFFMSKIYPKLRDFELRTWSEIERETTGKEGRSKHHSIDIKDLSKEAQKRLNELNINDLDCLFSLRLDGTLRVFGIRKLNYLRILWIDPDHEVCISNKKHT